MGSTARPLLPSILEQTSPTQGAHFQPQAAALSPEDQSPPQAAYQSLKDQTSSFQDPQLADEGLQGYEGQQGRRWQGQAEQGQSPQGQGQVEPGQGYDDRPWQGYGGQGYAEMGHELYQGRGSEGQDQQGRGYDGQEYAAQRYYGQEYYGQDHYGEEYYEQGEQGQGQVEPFSPTPSDFSSMQLVDLEQAGLTPKKAPSVGPPLAGVHGWEGTGSLGMQTCCAPT